MLLLLLLQVDVSRSLLHLFSQPQQSLQQATRALHLALSGCCCS
jgi:hypothetical protein